MKGVALTLGYLASDDEAVIAFYREPAVGLRQSYVFQLLCRIELYASLSPFIEAFKQ